jgi:alcohol dehydrogenase class IV
VLNGDMEGTMEQSAERNGGTEDIVASGWEALAECLDAYGARTYRPAANGMAVEAIRLLFENLPKLAANPDDPDARRHVEAAIAIGKDVAEAGGTRTLVSGLTAGPAGIAMAVVLPYVLTANRSTIEGKMARLRLNVPHTLKDLGVAEPPQGAEILVRAWEGRL